jgi:DNA polymerase-3 subunit delta'
MSLINVRFQPRAHRIIQRALASGRVPHAYFFCGPEGVGKGLMARRFAACLACQNPAKRDWPDDWGDAVNADGAIDGCGECENCRLASSGTHPDIHRIYKELVRLIPGKESHKATALGIDVVRKFLIDPSRRRPMTASRKVFIVEESEKLSIGAQNALLKTLEEPPDDTFIVLLAVSASQLLPTTRSRCQRADFGPLPFDFVFDRLQQESEIGPDAAHYLARRSSGRLGVALEWRVRDYVSLKREFLERLVAADVASVEELAKWMIGKSQEIGEQSARETPGSSATEINREAIVMLLGGAGSALRDALVLNAGGAKELLDNRDQAEIVDNLRERFDVDEIGGLIRLIARTESYFLSNANVQLSLENWLLSFVDGPTAQV